MKINKVLKLLFAILILNGVYSQDLREQQSKIMDFVSKTGVLIKIEDYNLPNLKLSYGIVEARIRKLTSGPETKLFYQISKEGEYDTKTASIAYEDLLETQKALVTLKSQSESVLSTNSDYVENKFVTDDGFQVGYYLSKGKLRWYLILEKYGDGNTVFVEDVIQIEVAFNMAVTRMEELE